MSIAIPENIRRKKCVRCDIYSALKADDYNMAELDSYISKFLPKELGVSTKKIADKVMEYRGV